MGFNEELDRKPETESTLTSSIENWEGYMVHEIEDPDFQPRNLKRLNQDETARRIQRIHRGPYLEKDKFKTLTDLSVWVDRHPEYRNENDNCEIVLGKTGVYLVVNPTDNLAEGIYFKDMFWSEGQWCKMDNSVDIVVFTHIFSKIIQTLEKN
jgi:hypothetical protein